MIKKAGLLSIFALCLAGLIGTALHAEETSEVTKTLNGEFEWNAGSQGTLEAVFTPTGKQTWTVDFHFEFRGKPHTYSGTAEGSLETGELSGEVRNDNKQRTFTFKGKFEDGTFRGTHAETTGGENRSTGTMSLSG